MNLLKAAILIGGRSRRMGRPKHLLGVDEYTLRATWLERTVKLVQPFVAETVLLGQGEVPPSCANLCRIADVEGISGPLAGILAVMRSEPKTDWLVLACDMPAVSAEAVWWVLEQRTAENRGVVPRLSARDWYEPLFALYTHRALELFEALYAEADCRIGRVARHPEIANPIVPWELRAAWRNVNTPEDLHLFYSERREVRL
ncbi:molybdenum cofactor guanylyltransferase [Desulforhopalus vacuolatus]|uniref:molybdenum cofactor guanylyltransferase n=1 Tax=Desulforhopalus vacuolatus TaxID=40414 RepID=UPI001965C03F|nr:molybdenum cofactor guanylyltransferase [Desulforhopalus vacuolatus]MBM9520151.1 molybdenum cofactor guanylyltransferase [Desulforhopalus vacuolatus]